VIRAGWGMYYDLLGSGLLTTYDGVALGLSSKSHELFRYTNPGDGAAFYQREFDPGFSHVASARHRLPSDRAKYPRHRDLD